MKGVLPEGGSSIFFGFELVMDSYSGRVAVSFYAIIQDHQKMALTSLLQHALQLAILWHILQ